MAKSEWQSYEVSDVRNYIFLLVSCISATTFSNLEKKQEKYEMNGETTVGRASTRRGSTTKSCQLHLLKITPRVRAARKWER